MLASAGVARGRQPQNALGAIASVEATSPVPMPRDDIAVAAYAPIGQGSAAEQQMQALIDSETNGTSEGTALTNSVASPIGNEALKSYAAARGPAAPQLARVVPAASFAARTPRLVAPDLNESLVLPVAMTLVADIYRPEERASIQGLLSGVWGGAAVLGPLIGAFLVAHLSWATVFWVNLPLGIAAYILCHRGLARVAVQRLKRPIDYLGAALLAPGVSALILFGTVHRLWIPLVACSCMAAVAAWLWARPEPAAPREV